MLRAMLVVIAALTFGLEAARAGPNDIAIIIANENYAGTVPKAGFAHRDGDEIKRLAREVLAVPESRIVLLKDATSGTLSDWFEAGGGVGPDLARLPVRADTV
ncbi:MAG TPA: hypothetical protein PK264_18075, partial [Hyphomicrobiaceae bacterium]|nr:hypothetical protein [Hyphomicrobiaceae bacterium]